MTRADLYVFLDVGKHWRQKAVTWLSVDLLSFSSLGTYFNGIFLAIQTFWLKHTIENIFCKTGIIVFRYQRVKVYKERILLVREMLVPVEFVGLQTEWSMELLYARNFCTKSTGCAYN